MGSPSALRKLNDRVALYALLESGPLSRHELESAASVSRPAAAELLRRLEESGLARRAGHRPGGPGPQAQLWTINERAAFAAGVDVSDTGLDAVISDLGGTPLGEAKTTVEPGEDPVHAVKRLLTATARRAGIRRSEIRQVAVGISGSVDPESGTLSHAEHIAEWTGFDVAARLSETLGVPVTVENDVKLVLSDEARRGRAVGCDEVLLLWMGHGISIAAITGGRLQRGFHGSAGEMTFVRVGPDGPFAGRLLATEGVLELARSHGLWASDPVELLESARGAENRAEAIGGFLTAFAGRIVDVLAPPVALIDPELVILGGEIGVAGGADLAELVRNRLHELLALRPRVVAGTGHANAVRQGALDDALERLRQAVFDNARDIRAS
ncbi:ROK family protein [Gryllotalpicola protaetiae]|uniref:ROK family protein n=1 Tax=Gryllotalpicola protaetiae TaxID=2419771 RepID=UPI0013C3F0BF|nr:ROK family transcriptional regulator [Gryllotalpicola protaetiae]